ncbi:MAG: peptidyl-prolyl cis-trans isomerase [Acidobacteriota bacterium]|nr:peptidyl-prolyl cis-trans isomerase [Acidobacteriota bacterium]MDQ7088104.1 peptidyl-prolyl cis-trans isomerase [Acidobacteriota bacterium]
MLNIFRSKFSRLKWVLWLVVISFVLFFGVSWWQPADPRTQRWVATVNGEEISPQLWYDQAQSLERQYRQMFGARYEEVAKNFNVRAQVAEQLIQRRLVVQDAQRMGLAVSQAELASVIRSTPVFQNEDGVFVGKEEYERRVRRISSYKTAAEYEAFLREELLVRKWRNLLLASIDVSPEEIEKEYRRRHERVGFDFVALDYSRYEKDLNPSPAELAAWYEAHRDRYSQGEGRRAVYLLFDDSVVGDTVSVSDEEIRKYYEENPQLFTRPEERRASHILIKVEPDADEATVEKARAQAESLAARARSGESFATLAAAHSDDPGSKAQGGDLGWFARGRMVPEFDDAVFGMEKGAIEGPVRTAFGFHVIQLVDVREPGTRPLEEVREQIAAQLRFPLLREAEKKAAGEFAAAATDLETFRRAAEAKGLELRDTGVISRSGTIPGMGPVPEMVKALFALEPGQVSEVLSLPRGEVILALQDVVDDYVPPLESQRERILADFRRDKGRALAIEALRRAAERSGGDLAGVARRLKVELQKIDPPMIRGAEMPVLGRDDQVESAAFNAPEGEITGPVEGSKAAVLLRVTRREEPDMAKLADERDAIRASLMTPLGERLIQQRIVALREGADVQQNPAIFRSEG